MRLQRLYSAIAASVAWLAFALYLTSKTQSCGDVRGAFWLWDYYLPCRTLNELGDYLAGILSPLGLGALILTLIYQADELGVMQKQAEDAKAVDNEARNDKRLEYRLDSLQFMCATKMVIPENRGWRWPREHKADTSAAFFLIVCHTLINDDFEQLVGDCTSYARPFSDLRRRLTVIAASLEGVSQPMKELIDEVELSDAIVRLDEALVRSKIK